MQYDLEIALPISMDRRYSQRLMDFKKLGVLNVNNRKVIVKLLVGDETPPKDALTGWPENVVVEVESGPYRHVASKIGHYYATRTEENAHSARWFAKVDDDSLNDIDGFVTNLDNEFDCEREYYIVTELRDDLESAETAVLKRQGYGRWLDIPKKRTVYHEWEANVISHAAMLRMVQNPASIAFLKERAAMQEGFGDHMLAVAAKIAKIYPSDAFFMTQHALPHHFSLFGGPFNHIHGIAHDRNEGMFAIVKKSLGQSKECQVFHKREYAMYANDKFVCTVKLRPSGTIERSAPHPNEVFWNVEGDKLVFYRDNGSQSTLFDRHNKDDYLSGKFLEDPTIVHVLRAIAAPVTVTKPNIVR